VGDGGDVVGCASKFVPVSAPGQWLDPGPVGCLGVGPSFAIAAKLLHPDRRVLLVPGDRALGLHGMGIETGVRFGLPMTAIIGNDGGWGQIRNPQLSFFGAERAVGTSLPFTRFDRMVEALGGRGVHVTDPAQIRPALDTALAADHVTCINVELDPAAYRRTGHVSMAIGGSPSSRRPCASRVESAPSSLTRTASPAAATTSRSWCPRAAASPRGGGIGTARGLRGCPVSARASSGCRS